jgi:hypothetical protein
MSSREKVKSFIVAKVAREPKVCMLHCVILGLPTATASSNVRPSKIMRPSFGWATFISDTMLALSSSERPQI